MKIYRLTKTKYINDLSGEGARLLGGRWNEKGIPLLYFSEHLSLCVLELLTRMDFEFITSDYSFLEAEVPNSLILTLKNPEDLTKKWRENPPTFHTQDYGSNWFKSNKTLGLSVPSAVLSFENNILINPNHKHFSKVKILCKSVLDIDSRVLI